VADLVVAVVKHKKILRKAKTFLPFLFQQCPVWLKYFLSLEQIFFAINICNNFILSRYLSCSLSDRRVETLKAYVLLVAQS